MAEAETSTAVSENGAAAAPVAETEQYTLKVRRFSPESGQGPYWQEFDVELDPTLSVLDALLQFKDREDGSLSVRCSCRAAICGSCGVKINGQSTLA
jgi:succinate dehydrogenase / fumarate reductase iron-sulfur subunit